jgi:hypothetical protein
MSLKRGGIQTEIKMMPVIRVSDETWNRMKGLARPLEDTADDIVRRALDALEGASIKEDPKRPAAVRIPENDGHEILPQKEFRAPILIALYRMGGSGTKQEVTKAVLPQVKKRLKDADFVMVQTGESRWENAVAWERSDLKKEGYLRSDSPRGVWELTQQGWAEAASLANGN